MSETAAPEKKATAPKTQGPRKYKNTSTANIFTAAGRVMPDQIVTLTEEQAKGVPGLETV